MPLICAAAAASVVVAYCGWRAYRQRLDLRCRILRERVAYLLWTMAELEPPAQHTGRAGRGGAPGDDNFIDNPYE
jgi:hypothetical protein